MDDNEKFVVKDAAGRFVERVESVRPDKIMMADDPNRAKRFERLEVLTLARRDNGLYFVEEARMHETQEQRYGKSF
jgi:hypothetical protein